MLGLLISGCGKASPTPPTAQAATVHINWTVEVPVSTAPQAEVHLSGNAKPLGDWDGRGITLHRMDANHFTGSVDLPGDAKSLEYKFTLGSWDTVEQTTDHSDVPNRTLSLDHDQAVAASVAAWRDVSVVVAKKSTLSGDIRFHRAFHSSVFNNDRTIAVWLPPGYDDAADKRYPVLYMQDGQNVFDDATSFAGEWHADETAAALIAAGTIEPIIIVAVDNGGTNRVFEYTPTARLSDDEAKKPAAEQKREGGGSEQTAQFFINEIKPMIDKTYRTLPDRDHTAIAGSSLGGLNALYLCWKHNDVFSRCGAVSPSLWWDHRSMLITFEADNGWMKRTKIWCDIGTAEGDSKDSASAVADVRELTAILSRSRLKKGVDFDFAIVENAAHNEAAWSARFDRVLQFLFPLAAK